ncbi:MAG: tyrosine-type recombinase/integrase [Chloroflexota bacterium]
MEHLLRHAFAVNYLMSGGDVFTLQQILGHTTLEMVRRYVNLASAHVMTQHNRFSPVDGLNLRQVNWAVSMSWNGGGRRMRRPAVRCAGHDQRPVQGGGNRHHPSVL